MDLDCHCSDKFGASSAANRGIYTPVVRRAYSYFAPSLENRYCGRKRFDYAQLIQFVH
jgi:hypothetical protein